METQMDTALQCRANRRNLSEFLVVRLIGKSSSKEEKCNLNGVSTSFGSRDIQQFNFKDWGNYVKNCSKSFTLCGKSCYIPQYHAISHNALYNLSQHMCNFVITLLCLFFFHRMAVVTSPIQYEGAYLYSQAHVVCHTTSHNAMLSLWPRMKLVYIYNQFAMLLFHNDSAVWLKEQVCFDS